MNVSSIGVVAVTPTTAVSSKPAPEPAEQTAPVLPATEGRRADNQDREQLSSPAPSTGRMVDRLA